MPIEINGLLHHNLSSELNPVPISDFDLSAIQAVAAAHEDAGYDKVLIAQAATMPDNIVIASTVAAVTQNLGVMLAHRPGFIAPTMAARTLATLDHLLQGKLAVHIITAANDIETQADCDYLTKAQRYQRSREYIGILRKIWASSDPIDHQGDFYKFNAGFAEIKPLQKDGIPIYFGGMSEDALTVGAECADTFATLSDTVAGMGEVIGKVRARAQPFGRNPDFLMSIRIILGNTEAEAWDKAEAHRERVVASMDKLATNSGAGSAEGFKRTAEIAQQGDRLEKCFWNGINKLRGEQSNSGVLVGTPDQVADAIMDYYRLGVGKFILRGFDPIADTQELGRNLLPRVRSLAAGIDQDRSPKEPTHAL